MSPLFAYLQTLRSRPLAVRNRVAFLGALVLTLLILVAWVKFRAWRERVPVVERPGPLLVLSSALGREWERVERGAKVMGEIIVKSFSR